MPHFLDNRLKDDGEVVPYEPTVLCPQKDFSQTFCYRQSRLQDHRESGRFKSIENRITVE
jgi:hypothetical protein